MIDKKDVYLNKNVYVHDEEVNIKVPGSKLAATIISTALVGTMLVFPYFSDVHWVLRWAFAFLIYCALFRTYNTGDENRYMKTYILLEDNKSRVHVMKGERDERDRQRY